jgi:hypothetical protein
MFMSPDTGGGEGSAASAAFQTGRIAVAVGGSEYLPLIITPAAVQKSKHVDWTYDPAFISVNPDTYGAVITGVKEGETYIKAAVDGISATALVTVSGFAPDYTSPPYLYSNFTVVQLTPGSTENVSVSLYGGQSWELEHIAWSVSDPSIAGISSSRNTCIINALKTGSAQLTASHPDCGYDYTMLIYVYSDTLTESYLSTSENIVHINTADAASKQLAVSVQNPSAAVNQSGFSWSFVDAGGTESYTSAILSLSPNGSTALAAPLTSGLQKVRVRYQDCGYPLDILVRVTTTVANVYIVPSTDTLIVKGGANAYNVYAEIAGYSGWADPAAFVWLVPDEAADLMYFQAAGNTLSVTGRKNGSVKVRVSHPLSETSRSVLIVLQEQPESAADASLYITTSQNYVQTQIGADPVEIQVSLAGGAPGDEALFSWAVENGGNNAVVSLNTPTGSIASLSAAGSYAYGKLIISPRAAGTATVSVSHPKILYSTDILVRVYSEYAQLAPPAYLTSDANIIRMLNGTSQEASVTLSGNYASGDENGIAWTSENPSVISVSPAYGGTVVLHAQGSGGSQTYIGASHPKVQSERRILVLSADTQTALDAMKGIYADKTYYRINAGSSDTLSLNQFGLTPQDIAAITWTVDKPNIATANAAAGNHLEASVAGVNAGTAAVTASLAGSPHCQFFITVLPEGESTGAVEPQYLTAAKNALALAAPGDSASVSVTGINISPASLASSTQWRVEDPSTASISANGVSASISALAPGRTKITVSHPESANTLALDVKVGALFEWDDTQIVYIAAEQDVVSLVKGESKTIGAALVNTTAQGGFSFSVTGKPIIEAAGSYSGVCLIEAREAGVSEITVRNTFAAADKEILVVVASSPEDMRGIPYLSTKQNVVTIGESFNTAVTVSVENSASPLLSGWHWSSDNPAVVGAVSSGAVAVLSGRKTGTAKITVRNDSCQYPLEIIANCVDPVLAANNPYIMSPNILTLYIGDPPAPLAAELIGGLDSDKPGFSWYVDDPSLVQLYAANDAAQVKALKEGVTQLIIRHPKANGIDRTVLIICERRTAADAYITTSESIIRMSPGGSARTVTATLSGGSGGDQNLFKWRADDYALISMNYTGSQAVITPLASGTVTVHVSHPKALYQKDIILYISQYSEFAFEKNQVPLAAGVQSFVNLHIPAVNVKTRTAYSVKKADGSGADASHIVSASGTNAVCILDPHTPGSAVIEASLIAVNSGAVQATAQLLVSVAQAPVNNTYINFPGSTIITLEKGVTRNFSASLAGTNAAAGDSDSLQWSSSDPSALKIAPVSQSGIAVRKEIQVTALRAGAEATLTVRHEKASSDIVLYFIIPGENAASVTLDRNYLSLTEGENPVNISASITNAEEKDYENLLWTLANADEARPALALSGGGKTVSLRPLARGQALLTARVPSSGKEASCSIDVEAPRRIIFSANSVPLFPSGEAFVSYTVSPESEAANLTLTVGDGSYVSAADNHNGTITLIGKYKEGSTFVEAASPSGIKARFSVVNEWGGSLSLNKTAITAVPVDSGGDTFTVKYTLRPACAELRVYTAPGLPLASGTYSQYINGVYIIDPSRHTVDPVTGIASGALKFAPQSESSPTVQITAWNPRKILLPNGGFEGAEAASRSIVMKIGYDSYSFNTPVIAGSQTGRFSRFDQAAGAFFLGDGEQFSFSLSPGEQNASPAVNSVRFIPNTSSRGDPDSDTLYQHKYVSNYPTGTSPDSGFALVSYNGAYTLYHTLDYGHLTGKYYRVAPNQEPAENSNTSVRAAPLAGSVRINYTAGTNRTRDFDIPVYVEVRNCTKTYQP